MVKFATKILKWNQQASLCSTQKTMFNNKNNKITSKGLIFFQNSLSIKDRLVKITTLFLKTM